MRYRNSPQAQKYAKRTKNIFNYTIAFVCISIFSMSLNFMMLFNSVFINVTDLSTHYSWAYSFSKGISAGYILPRWSADSNLGLGEPTFYYYAPLTYYMCALINVLFDNIWNSLRITLITSNIIAGLVTFCHVYNKSVFRGLVGAFAIQASPMFFMVLSFNAAFAWAFALPFYVLVFILYARQPLQKIISPALAVVYAMVCLSHILSGLMIGLSLAMSESPS